MEPEEIEKIFDKLYEIWLKFDLEKKGHITGISEIEYEKLKKMYKKDFPYAFSIYLKRYANEPLNIFSKISHNYKGIIESQKVADRLLNEYNKKLPDNSFVFGHNWHTSFFYFVDNNTNDPDIYLYNERNCEYDQSEYQLVNYEMGRFTDFIISQTDGELFTRKRPLEEIKMARKMLKEIKSINGT